MSLREERHGADDTAAAGPVSVDLALNTGSIHLTGGVEPGPGVTVRVEADAAPGTWWAGGMSTLLGRVEEQLLGSAPDPAERARRAVEATEIGWDPATRRLRVRAPDDRALRSVPLTVTVHADRVGALHVRAGAGDVRADVAVGGADVETTGRVDLVALRRRSTLRRGAGTVRVGEVAGPLTVRGGAGEVVVDRVAGPLEIATGAGRVRLGEVHADVAVRLASGDVTVADAVTGDLDLSTGAGAVRVGVHPGVDARLDLHTLAGRAASELDVHEHRAVPDARTDGADAAGERAARPDPVCLRARSKAGDVLVHGADGTRTRR